jgi:two-component system, LytTR family, response regulator
VNVIIVEDESLAVDAIKKLLHDHTPELTTVGVARDGEEAVELIEKFKPGLVFLDIELPGFSGLQVLSKISYSPKVIFTTAYSQYAIDAFELNAVDYLLKPISSERFAHAIHRIKSTGEIQLEKIARVVDQISSARTFNTLNIRSGDKILFIPLMEITHFFAEDKYVLINTIESKQYITNFTIQELPEKLPGNFLRISRSVVINYHLIAEARKEFGRRYCITMKDRARSEVFTGEAFVDNFLRRIEDA